MHSKKKDFCEKKDVEKVIIDLNENSESSDSDDSASEAKES